MNFFKKSKPAIAPESVIKNFGLVSERRKGIAKFKYDVLLIEKHGKKRVVIRESTTLIGGETRHFEFDAEGITRLKEALASALKMV